MIAHAMETVSRYLMIGGIALFLVGGAVFLAAKLGLPLGRLPGDIRIEREHGGFYFPLASCLLASIVLSLLVNVIARLWKR